MGGMACCMGSQGKAAGFISRQRQQRASVVKSLHVVSAGKTKAWRWPGFGLARLNNFSRLWGMEVVCYLALGWLGYNSPESTGGTWQCGLFHVKGMHAGWLVYSLLGLAGSRRGSPFGISKEHQKYRRAWLIQVCRGYKVPVFKAHLLLFKSDAPLFQNASPPAGHSRELVVPVAAAG